VKKGLNWIVDYCSISLAAGSIQVDVSESNPDESLVVISWKHARCFDSIPFEYTPSIRLETYPFN